MDPLISDYFDFTDYSFDVQDLIDKFHAEFLEAFLERHINKSMWEIYNLLDEENPKEQIEQLCRSFTESTFGDVMVVGGGISGIPASLDLATAGF